MSWSLSRAAGLLEQCSLTFINCQDPLQWNRTVYPDPQRPLSIPAITCGGSTDRMLRVWYGSECQIWQQDNAAGCHWNATAQAFSGTGCVRSGPTQCACVHLTDFASARAPKISVASPRDLIAVTPGDIITKLRFFLYLIAILFGVMHVGAALGYLRDKADRCSAIESLQAPGQCGFAEREGAWTWFLVQDPLEDDVFKVGGSFVNASGVIGLPFARLRMAIPEDLIPGNTQHVVGRRLGLSASWLAGNKEATSDSVKEMYGRKSSTGMAALARAKSRQITPASEAQMNGKGSSADPERGSAPPDAITEADKLQLMSGTALVFAYLAIQNVVTPMQLNEQLEKASTFFEGTASASGLEFRRLVFLFTGLLFPANLPQESNWVVRARLWRFIFLQREDGSFELTQGLAGALHAHTDEAGDADDDPLSFSPEAVRRTMPEAMGAVVGDARARERLWATMLSAKTLSTLKFGWLVDEDENETIVDRATKWVQAHMEGGNAAALWRAAEETVEKWSETQEMYIGNIRTVETRSLHHVGTQMQRSMGEIVRSVLVRHETFGTFLSPVSEGMPRWQKFMLLFTMIMSVLVVDVWFYWSRAINCCSEVRALLGCETDYARPCREFDGDCADLEAQFMGVQDSGLEVYVCHAFPDSENPVDSFIVGLICAAIALPFALIVEEMFAMSNEPDFPEGHMTWPTLYRILLGKQRWNFAETQPGTLMMLMVRFSEEPIKIPVELLLGAVAKVYEFLHGLCCGRRGGGEQGAKGKTEEEGGESAYEEGKESALKRRMLKKIGLGFTYAAWAIMTWMIFVYGRLIYLLLGSGAEQEFTKTWLTGLAIENATQFQDVLKEAVKAALILAFLEHLFIPKGRWFALHLDFLSVQATLYSVGPTTWWQRMRAHLRHYAYALGA